MPARLADHLDTLIERRGILATVLSALTAAADRERRLFSLEELDLIDAVYDELRSLDARASALRRAASRPKLTLVPRTPPAEPERRAVTQ